jgi:septal ring factor EnvC (AmiA/AmiB activator)
MGWKEDQQILRDLETIKADVKIIKHSQSKLEDNQKALFNKFDALSNMLEDVKQQQKDCCQVLNTKLDQLIKALIQPPPKEPAGFTAFLS